MREFEAERYLVHRLHFEEAIREDRDEDRENDEDRHEEVPTVEH